MGSFFKWPRGPFSCCRYQLRAMIEASACKVKQGPLVREGLLIEWVSFCYDVKRYGETLGEVVKTAQFTVPVVVQRQRILRTRAKFDCPWWVVGVADVDEDLVDKAKLTAWLALGGRRIGLGDWRPEKSGVFGRFDVEEVLELADDAARRSLPAGADARPRPGNVAGRGVAGRPDKGRIATSDARVARVRLQGTVSRRGMAWRGLTWLGAAWRGEAGTVF